MEEIIDTLDAPKRSALARRTLLKGAAWSVPAVVVVGATPAFAATGGALAFSTQPAFINAANVTAVVFTGTAPVSLAGQTVAIAPGTSSGGQIQANGTWTVTVDTSDVSDGVGIVFTASTSGATDATTQVTMDTQAPALTIDTTATSVAQDRRSGTLQGLRGVATSPTSDNQDVAASGSASFNFNPTVYTAPNGWSISWTWSTGTAAGQTITVTQTDVAGNTETDTYVVPA